MKTKLNLPVAGMFQAALVSFPRTLLMGMLLCTPALTRLHAQLFYDDFEAYQAGSFPGNGWTLVYNGAGDQFQRDESGTAASGTNALRLVGQPGWAAVADHPVQFPLRFAVEAMVFTESATVGYFGAANPAVGPWGISYGSILFWQGQIEALVDTVNYVWTNLATYTTGRWYHAKSVYNFYSLRRIFSFG